MNFEERLEDARARRKIALAQKRAPRSELSLKSEQAMDDTPAPDATFVEESAQPSALVRTRPVIGGLSAAVGVFAAFAVIAERLNVMPQLHVFSASVSPQVHAEPPVAISEPSVSLSATASDAASFSSQALPEAGLPAAELRWSSLPPPGLEDASAEAAVRTVAVAPSRIAALSAPVQRAEVEAPQIAPLALPGMSTVPSRGGPATLISAALSAEPPKAKEPVPAFKRARPMDLRVFVPNLAPAGTMQDVQDRIVRSGYVVTDASDVPHSISQTQVRYYQRAYRDQAEALAEALGARPRDFSDRSGTATEGVVELWLAGDGAAPVAPLRSSVSRNVVAPASVAAKEREVRVLRTTRTQSEGGGLGALLGAVIGGGRDISAPNSGDRGPIGSPSISKPSGGAPATDAGGSGSKGNKGKGGSKGKGGGNGKGKGGDGGKGKDGKGKG
ncbi:LytR C-terminal domain-containing protein [Silicimonas algicola]|nr:LytR C-terminal domain-containing protein [Silicimonas algicola]